MKACNIAPRRIIVCFPVSPALVLRLLVALGNCMCLKGKEKNISRFSPQIPPDFNRHWQFLACLYWVRKPAPGSSSWQGGWTPDRTTQVGHQQQAKPFIYPNLFPKPGPLCEKKWETSSVAGRRVRTLPIQSGPATAPAQAVWGEGRARETWVSRGQLSTSRAGRSPGGLLPVAQPCWQI